MIEPGKERRPARNAGQDLSVWTGALTTLGSEVTLGDPLTVVETTSGQTAAIARRFSVVHGTSLGNTLIVASVLYGGPLVFEVHQSQTNYGKRRQADRFDACDFVCTRLVIDRGRARSYTASDPGSYAEMTGQPDDIIRGYMRRIAHPEPGQDVFFDPSGPARAGADEVLERHLLWSVAAREAFGQEGLPALPAPGYPGQLES